MEEQIATLSSTPGSLAEREHSLKTNRVDRALGMVFLVASAFYLFTAETSRLLTLRGRALEPYNQLADAFLHLHLSIGRAPAALLRLPDPYDPAQNAAIAYNGGVGGSTLHDLALYHGHLFLTWGPAPVVVLLVPMHLLGLEPSASLVIALFAIVGLGFALATLRILIGQIGNTTLWMCVLAAFTLALSSAVPFLLRRPAVYEEAIAGGYCFAMAGIWLAVAALADRRASLWRLVLMSLCFGLATGSRPTLGLTALLLVPVYMSLRSSLRRGRLLAALAIPVAGCFLLLLAYNQARFGDPLQFGTKYALAGINSYTAHFGDPSYVPPGVWFYAMSPPRPLALFPFIRLGPPPILYPASLPANYESELTGGLLPMTPIVIFLAALPWIWHRRPALLGTLAVPLLLLAGVGIACLLFLSYEFFATTERYEVDFTTLLLFGALAVWLALSDKVRGRWRRLVRTGGGLLAIWGCLAGAAISFTGYSNLFATGLPGTWATLENIGSPLSIAVATIAGRPVLAELSASNLAPVTHVSYGSLSAGVAPFWLSAGEQANLTIVSPDVRGAALRARVAPGAALGAGASLWVVMSDPGHWSDRYRLPSRGGAVQIPVSLGIGVNHLVLSPLASAVKLRNPRTPSAQALLVVTDLSLASHS